jgi:short-subunit dehydrogenase
LELLVPTKNNRNQTILITGASSGIGASFARAMAARGSDLILVARRRDRLDALATELMAAYGVTVTAITQDLASPSSGKDLHATVAAAGLQVTGVINNAGFGTYGQLVEATPDWSAQEIAVGVSAPVQISSAFLPAMITAGSGFLINVASLAGYTPLPGMAVYGAAKAFVLSFTEALWVETRTSGVTVFVVSPGTTNTEFDDSSRSAKARSADDVVATALAHLDRRNSGPSVIDGTSNRLTAILPRFMSRRATALLVERVTNAGRRKKATRTRQLR